MDANRPGNTAHVDHANVLYMTPANDNGNPIVFLHGYGQSRMGWLTTPDGRDGWAQMFLRSGHAAYLVDQPGRGEAGAAVTMTQDGFLDAWSAESKDYKPAIRPGTPISALAGWPRNAMKAASSRRARKPRTSSSVR